MELHQVATIPEAKQQEIDRFKAVAGVLYRKSIAPDISSMTISFFLSFFLPFLGGEYPT